ncbi:MAG: N-acetylmuramoyl-L-alanine amidase [Phycisphaerales bacterium]|nr:N-acetylmuramoyl-L-alanine amidase [Phycisphaerales bacterium]
MTLRDKSVVGLLVLLAITMTSCRTPADTRSQVATHAEEAPAVVDPQLAIDTLYPAPPDYAERRMAEGDYPIPLYAKFLRGVRICLDPGHGGDAHQRGFKRGPTGVREAEMNLRVAQYLRVLLEVAGAEVRLTREDDVDSTLRERADVANEWNADLFISLHHNAISNRPQVNYTTVWYHRDVDYRPANLDLARYLCDGLLDALQLPQITDVPLKSDQLMYEAGFGILRHARVTAALTESSFFTNPEEEQRLRDPEYNLQEAYGLFLGLARYTAAGLPRAYLRIPEDGVLPADSTQTLVFELDDGLRSRRAWGHDRQMILSDTIVVRVAGQVVPHAFDNDGYTLEVPWPEGLPPGEYAVEVQFMNNNKNSVLDPHFQVTAE